MTACVKVGYIGREDNMEIFTIFEWGFHVCFINYVVISANTLEKTRKGSVLWLSSFLFRYLRWILVYSKGVDTHKRIFKFLFSTLTIQEILIQNYEHIYKISFCITSKRFLNQDH